MKDLVGVYHNQNHIIAVNTTDSDKYPDYHVSKIHLRGGGVTVEIVRYGNLKKYLFAGHYSKKMRLHLVERQNLRDVP